ncbi:MAG: glycosyltransferase family 4 protein [Cyanobacteria bacterium P01_D01_bin.44]
MQLTHLRKTFKIHGPLLMYVGNLEKYQGIDLLLNSFQMTLDSEPTAHLVIIGGASTDIEKYQQKAQQLAIHQNIHFTGPRPIEHLGDYLEQADILVSPRTQGNNTPMKLYSYLDSGKALLATDLPTHTQVLNGRVAWLAQPQPGEFSQGMLTLIQRRDLRQQLGREAQALVKQQHTYEAFSTKLASLYDWLQIELLGEVSSPNLSGSY